MLARWCKITSCSGIIDLYQARSNKGQFIFWVVVIATMTTASVYFTYKAVESYMVTPYVTNLAIIQNATLQLPEVSICYGGGWNVSEMQKAGLSENFVHAFSRVDQIVNADKTAPIDYKAAEVDLHNYMKKHGISYSQIFRKFGYKCTDFIPFLARQFQPINNHCEVAREILTYNGPCFVFKSEGYQWSPLSDGGYKFQLKAPVTSYSNVYPNEAFASNINNEFFIAIEKTFRHQMSFRSTFVPINSKVNIVLNPILYKRFGEGKTCEGNHNLYGTSNDCFFQCWKKQVDVTCNCTMVNYVGIDLPDESRFCNPFDQCIGNVDTQASRKCNRKCLRKCEEWVFERTVSYTSFDERLFNKTNSLVYIYSNAMQYTQISEVASFSFDMAIADIGGQLGLWLGVSIVTIIQAIYYAMLGIFSVFDKFKNFNNLKPVVKENTTSGPK